VIVEGLPPGTNWHRLKDMFKQFKPVRADVSPAGKGTVIFETPEGAECSLAMHGTVVEGRSITVRLAEFHETA
jgi:hypothetical protein